MVSCMIKISTTPPGVNLILVTPYFYFTLTPSADRQYGPYDRGGKTF